MIITFVGHGSLCYGEEIFQKVIDTVKASLPSNEKVSFYCGGYGNFDHLCMRACRKLMAEGVFAELVFVTPYLNASSEESKLYNEILYPPLETVPPRYAISKRNQWMVLQADLIVAYVVNSFGGAYKTLEFAVKKKKNIINLAK